MAGSRKHGAHRENLQIQITAAATAPKASIYTHDAFAEAGGGSGASSTGAGYDQYVEAITEMSLTLESSLTGQVTNFTTFSVTHRNAAGSTVDAFTIVAGTTAFVFVAFIPANLAVASGAVIPGGGTGTLTIGTGVALPWTLMPGDTVTFTATVTGTGQYTGGATLAFLIAGKGA